ncbi:hypothetical protein LMG29739_00806 [Paraburkholderia solisilvae]|uniref:Uncharacterized protein n=1 Tax=Paraburkholderia solisilvae TaxID=624376 RepID=A0A6J5D6H6_9BURK|nr:hypothetical protein LMG29739_00806 [Paraburkholderia solisilvae]
MNEDVSAGPATVWVLPQHAWWLANWPHRCITETY